MICTRLSCRSSLLVGLLTGIVIAGFQVNIARAENSASEKFASLATTFMHDSLALSPSRASQVGYHKYQEKTTGKVLELDARLDDLSASGIARQLAFYKEWRDKFHKETPLSALGPQESADWHLLDDHIALTLLELEKIQNYKHNPASAIEMIGDSLLQPLTEDYAPVETRLAHILSRISLIPRFLQDQKACLSDADPVYIKTAIDENQGTIDLIENTIKAEIPAGSKLDAQYAAVAPPAVSALKDYSRWLGDEFSKRPATRSWRLGKELYDQKFKLVMQADFTPEQLLADAESDLKKVRAQMLQTALPLYKQAHPETGDLAGLADHARENLIIKDVLQKISDDHTKRKELQQTIEKDLNGIKQFIADKKIVSLSARDNLKVIPTPVFERGVLSVAAFHGAPPLNPKAEAQYWVTPIEDSVPENVAESKLREYNNFTLKWLTIHEALPGHYIQSEHLNNLCPEWRRLLRALYSNGAYEEGWAEYIAQVMMDKGFMGGDARFAMVMRKIRLRVICNAILDIKMHTQNMTDNDALNFMAEEAFQTDAEANGKLLRAQLTSTQLPTYYAGLREWFSLRKKYEAASAGHFDMMQFHDRALDVGPLPVPIVEKLILPAS